MPYKKVVRKSNLKTMNAFQIGWVSGIIEGEGTFFCTIRRKRKYPIIAVGMTDEDVIVKIQRTTGVGKFTVVSKRGLMKKEKYVWKVSRAVDSIALANELLPYMGVRRQDQIKRMINSSSVRHIEANL